MSNSHLSQELQLSVVRIRRDQTRELDSVGVMLVGVSYRSDLLGLALLSYKGIHFGVCLVFSHIHLEISLD